MKKILNDTLFITACILLFALITASPASELVWSPINPNFVGGNYWNGSWLLSQAQAQNSHIRQTASYQEEDLISEFEDNLNRELLDRLATKILDEAFGEDTDVPLADGTYSVGGNTIVIDTSGSQINIEITNGGSSTTITVPYY
ncbi:MAG: curli assembly protein CsgF [Sedimentisphaerales bacterium]|nr:curli assembly protein CsgF [Sedimentisphaerales bacterium]